MLEPNLGLALLLPVLAGLSTTIGSILGIVAQKPGPRMMSVSLGFAAGVMILISFAELLPHGIETIGFLGGYIPHFLPHMEACLKDTETPTTQVTEDPSRVWNTWH